MRLQLIVPFRVNILFDRKWIAYDKNRVEQYFRKHKLVFDKDGFELGSSLLPIVAAGGYYSDITDAGEAFRSNYLGRMNLHLEIKELLTPNCWLENFLIQAQGGVLIDVCWLDREFACATITLNINEQSLAVDRRTPIGDFDRVLNNFANSVYTKIKPIISKKTADLLTLKYVQKSPQSGGAWNEPNLSDHSLWVHKVWEVKKSIPKRSLLGYVSDKTLNAAFIGNSNEPIASWGWGDSLLFNANSKLNCTIETDWHYGMLLAQYFHAELDRMLRSIPHSIEQLRHFYDRGQGEKAQALSDDTIYRVNTLLTEFDMSRRLTGGQTHLTLVSLIYSWKTDRLAESVSNKLPYLEALNRQISEKLRAWTQSSIEIILFVSAVVGLFSLAMSVHDYLSPGKLHFALHLLDKPHSNDPIIFAFFSFIFCLFIFIVAKTGYFARFAILVRRALITLMRFLIKALR